MGRNCAIDIAKYIAAILVIGIHTHPFKEISGVMDFFTADVICRIAVPFFAVCTGYYLSIGLLFDEGGRLIGDKDNCNIIKRTLVKIGILYLGWSLFYLIYLHINWILNGSDINIYYYIGYFEALITRASFYHLWYLLAVIYAIIPFYVLLRYVKFKYIPVIVGVLWSIECIESGYRVFLPEYCVKWFMYYDFFGTILAGIFRVLPLLLVGVIIARAKSIINCTLKSRISILCVFVSIMIVEIIIVTLPQYIERSNSNGIGGYDYTYIVSTLSVAFCFFLLIEKVGERFELKKSRWLAKISMLVYCLHPIIISSLKDVGITSPMMLFILTVIVTTVLSGLYYWVKYFLKCILRL